MTCTFLPITTITKSMSCKRSRLSLSPTATKQPKSACRPLPKDIWRIILNFACSTVYPVFAMVSKQFAFDIVPKLIVKDVPFFNNVTWADYNKVPKFVFKLLTSNTDQKATPDFKTRMSDANCSVSGCWDDTEAVLDHVVTFHGIYRTISEFVFPLRPYFLEYEPSLNKIVTLRAKGSSKERLITTRERFITTREQLDIGLVSFSVLIDEPVVVPPYLTVDITNSSLKFLYASGSKTLYQLPSVEKHSRKYNLDDMVYLGNYTVMYAQTPKMIYAVRYLPKSKTFQDIKLLLPVELGKLRYSFHHHTNLLRQISDINPWLVLSFVEDRNFSYFSFYDMRQTTTMVEPTTIILNHRKAVVGVLGPLLLVLDDSEIVVSTMKDDTCVTTPVPKPHDTVLHNSKIWYNAETHKHGLYTTDKHRLEKYHSCLQYQSLNSITLPSGNPKYYTVLERFPLNHMLIIFNNVANTLSIRPVEHALPQDLCSPLYKSVFQIGRYRFYLVDRTWGMVWDTLLRKLVCGAFMLPCCAYVSFVHNHFRLEKQLPSTSHLPGHEVISNYRLQLPKSFEPVYPFPTQEELLDKVKHITEHKTIWLKSKHDFSSTCT